MSDERMAPVQGYSAGIPWSLHLRAWDAYAAKYGRYQSAEGIAERSGFSVGELDVFVPGWRDEVSEIAKLRAEVARLRAEDQCDACAGTGKPISGLPCMCRGTGKMSVAALHLRERLVARDAEVARLTAILDTVAELRIDKWLDCEARRLKVFNAELEDEVARLTAESAEAFADFLTTEGALIDYGSNVGRESVEDARNRFHIETINAAVAREEVPK